MQIVYGPGEYVVEVTLRYHASIAAGERATEEELVRDCQMLGETVDWGVE
jgi:hypothetical protein